MALPFPEIDSEKQIIIENLINDIMLSGNDDKLQTFVNKDIFGFDDIQIEYINRFIPKRYRKGTMDKNSDDEKIFKIRLQKIKKNEEVQ